MSSHRSRRLHQQADARPHYARLGCTRYSEFSIRAIRIRYRAPNRGGLYTFRRPVGHLAAKFAFIYPLRNRVAASRDFPAGPVFDLLYGLFTSFRGLALERNVILLRGTIMKTRELIWSVTALIALCGAPVFAQSGTNSTSGQPGEIQQRKDNQQDRIANGVQDGQLTTGETKRLETGEAALNTEEHTMRQDDNGHLTAADRARLNRQQNGLSNRIYDDKHNGAVQHDGPGEIGQREQNQQDRIAQGVRSGQLRPGETARLENQQQGIHREVSADRQANGGHLTGADRRAINQSQNRASRNIYNKKHNARTR